MKQIGEWKVHPIANMVPMMGENEQAALNKDILKNGQVVPIKIYHGKIADGRCRTIACMNAGIEVLFEEIPYNTTLIELTDLIMSCNIRRNLTSTQKAISAYKKYMSAGNTIKLKDIIKAFSTNDPQIYAVKWLSKNMPAIIPILFKGNAIKLTKDSLPTKSLQLIYKHYRTEREKEIEEIKALATGNNSTDIFQDCFLPDDPDKFFLSNNLLEKLERSGEFISNTLKYEIVDYIKNCSKDSINSLIKDHKPVKLKVV